MPLFDNNEEGIVKLSKHIISNFGDITKYEIKNKKAISALFLAGAPGAGKTEFLNTIFGDLKKSFIVIDIDEYRKSFKGYNGENSSEYQKSSVKVADKILKFCFKNNLNFVFDGTFRNYNKVKQNFGQCKKYNRLSLITLIYQEPRISFYYTFLRKLKKSRNVPIDVFVSGFYESISNVFQVIKEFENCNLLIAYKKYNLLNKEKFKYNMDYKTKNIINFCDKYKILFKKGKFGNKKKLKLDLEGFHNTLILQFFGGNNKWYTKIKIWILEKIYKLY